MPKDTSGPKRTPRPARRGRDADGPLSRYGAEVTEQAKAEAPEAAEPITAKTATATIDAPKASSPAPAAAPARAAVQPEPDASEPEAAPVVAHSPGGRRRRGRRVTRVVRRIDLWSVLKLSLIVYSCLYAAMLGTLAALWSLAYSSGSIDKLQSFLEDVGLENFTFYGNQMFRACAAIGGVAVIAGTVITVLATALVNVISEMSGGIRLVVIEEDVDRR